MNMTEHNQAGVVYLTADGLRAAGGVVHGFSTRLGGVSQGIFDSMNLGASRGDDRAAVRENYQRFCTAIGTRRDNLVLASQVHGQDVRTVTSADRGLGLDWMLDFEADGLVTDVPGLGLVVFAADCLPVLFYDPVRRVVAAVHAGWRGTALGIVNRAVEKMVEQYGCCPGDLLAAIGPGISKCCFETSQDVPEAMVAALGDCVQPYLQAEPAGKFRVDLKGINALRLEQAGLTAEHIAISTDCTACLPGKYWSHRMTQGQRGSQAAIIALTEDTL